MSDAPVMIVLTGENKQLADIVEDYDKAIRRMESRIAGLEASNKKMLKELLKHCRKCLAAHPGYKTGDGRCCEKDSCSTYAAIEKGKGATDAKES